MMRQDEQGQVLVKTWAGMLVTEGLKCTFSSCMTFELEEWCRIKIKTVQPPFSLAGGTKSDVTIKEIYQCYSSK
jgi:hypothetical protein